MRKRRAYQASPAGAAGRAEDAYITPGGPRPPLPERRLVTLHRDPPAAVWRAVVGRDHPRYWPVRGTLRLTWEKLAVRP